MIILPSLLLLAQAVVVQTTPHERGPKTVDKTISASCSDEHNFTFILNVTMADNSLAVLYNGNRVISQVPDALASKIGKRYITDASPLVCIGDGGSDGLGWVLTTYDPRDDLGTGKAFVRVVRSNTGWNLLVDEVSNPS